MTPIRATVFSPVLQWRPPTAVVNLSGSSAALSRRLSRAAYRAAAFAVGRTGTRRTVNAGSLLRGPVRVWGSASTR